MPRREHDFYPTPAWATRELLTRINISGVVLEPCAGKGDITSVLIDDHRISDVWDNDLDYRHPVTSHHDATDPNYWHSHGCDYVVTNPPFNLAHKIVPMAVAKARIGVYMLLRLSYLEPCDGRAGWLKAHPPNVLLVLPRISFTGDGKTDNMTCAWFGWDKHRCGQTIEIVSPVEDGTLLSEGIAS